MKKAQIKTAGDFIIEEEESDEDDDEKIKDRKDRDKELVLKKKKSKQQGNANLVIKQNELKNELILEKKSSSKKKLSTHMASSFQKNYNHSIGLWKYLNFMYAFDFIKKFIDQGKMPNLHDFPYPLKNENIDYYYKRLQEVWDSLVEKRTAANKQINGYHLRKAVRTRFHRGLVKCALLGLFDSLLKIISCVSMGLVMKMIQKRNLPEPIYYSSFYWILNISILFISLVIGTYCKTWFYHYSFELASKIRFSLIALIYDKVQEINVSVFGFEIQPGRIINMCANDLNDLDYGLSWVFQLLLLPINLFLSTLIIYYYLGIYSIVGVITLIIFIGLQEYYTNKVSQPLQMKNKQTDLRINLAKQLITHIKILKMYSWDQIFQSQIIQVRKEELDLTRNVMESIGIARSISNSSVLLSAFCMCVLYHYFSDGSLTYEKVFSSLSILNVVKSSLGYFSCSRGWLANIDILSDRVTQVLLSKKKPKLGNTNEDVNLLDFIDEDNKQNNQEQKEQKIRSSNKQEINIKVNKSLNNSNNSNNNVNKDKQNEIEMKNTDINLPTIQYTCDNMIDSDSKNDQITVVTSDKIRKQDNVLQNDSKKEWKYDEKSQDLNNSQLQKNQQITDLEIQSSKEISEQRITTTTKQTYQLSSKIENSHLYPIKEKRYQKSESEKDDFHSHNESSSSSNDEGKRKGSSLSTFIKLSNFDAYWDSNIASLENVNLYLTNSFKFVQIIGKSGSGKSTLLLSILQEISNHTGQIEISGKVSYVPQESVIYTGTIKQNILFGSEYDYIRYSHVKALCNLNEDIDKLAKKDDTYLLEGGSNLSGGQKMRVNLARALYSKSQIVLLDDPLAALDPKVSEKIFKKMFKTRFLDGRLVLMSSHQLQYSQEADYILILEGGKVAQQGTYNELQQIIKELQYNEQKEREKNETIMQKYKEYEEELQMNIYSTSGTSNNNSFSASFKIDSHDSSDMDGNEEALKGLSLDMMKNLNVMEGYKNYIWNMGGVGQLVFLIGLYISIELSYIFFSTYFGDLSNTQSNQTIVTCGLFALSFLVLDLIKTIYFCRLNHHASEQLHSKMLDSVTKAPMSFFASNSIGNIINRFSNDVGVVDKTLPACLLDLIRGIISNLILIITVCIFNLPLVPLAVIILVGLVYTRKQFSQVISISKQADLSSRSPIFNLLAETMTNLTVIRVFNQQDRFKANFLRSIYDNTRAFYSMSKNQRMFDLFLELIITGMIVVGISYILISLFVFDVGGTSVTLSIYFLINLGQGFSYAVRQTLTADINMLSTQRICEYATIEPEENSTQNNQENKFPLDQNMLKNFPKSGQIAFNNINLRYPNDIKLTLKKLTFNIRSGQRIGVVGRTGAGKSSLINALFRLYPIQHTPNALSSITIDGINIEDIPLPILRNSISIIPQEPIIFQGNTRFNLDPTQKYSDIQLLNVLKEVGLSNKITSLQDDLQSLSVGEKQLICLARAFLKNSQILILDEMTANLDKTIDEFIQEKVRVLFKNKTIIAIAHRLISIADYDKILVLENGYLKDFDHPFMLLVENENDTKITKKKNIFAGLVKNTGKETARKIMYKSRDVYFEEKMRQDDLIDGNKSKLSQQTIQSQSPIKNGRDQQQQPHTYTAQMLKEKTNSSMSEISQ